MTELTLPEAGDLYRHKRTGSRYEVVGIANDLVVDADYPVLVVYRDQELGYLWAKPVERFMSGMEKVE